MNKNQSSLRRLLQNKKVLLFGAAILALIGLLAAIWIPTQQPQKMLSLSTIASDIASNKITKIDDTLITGDLVVHYRDGRTEKAIRDTNQSLLEQLTYLGLKGEQLAKVQFEMVKSATCRPAKRSAL